MCKCYERGEVCSDMLLYIRGKLITGVKLGAFFNLVRKRGVNSMKRGGAMLRMRVWCYAN